MRLRSRYQTNLNSVAVEREGSGRSELRRLVVCRNRGPVLVNAAAEIEPLAGVRGRDRRRCRYREARLRRGEDHVVAALGRRRARPVAARHELRAAVAVHVGSNPINSQEPVIRAVGDHPAQFSVEPVDQGRCVRPLPPNREIKRTPDQRYRSDLQPASRLVAMVAHDVLDDQFIHQRVVRLVREKPGKAVLLAARLKERRTGSRCHCIAVRVAPDQHDPLALERGQRRGRYVAPASPYEDQPVLEVGSENTITRSRSASFQTAALPSNFPLRRDGVNAARPRSPSGRGPDALEGLVNEIERELRLARRVREGGHAVDTRCNCGGWPQARGGTTSQARHAVRVQHRRNPARLERSGFERTCGPLGK